MNTLHLVRKSAFTHNDFAQCLSMFAQDDAIVFMDDGCYNLNHTLIKSLLERMGKNINLNVISSHAQARAIDNHLNVKCIAMSDLVDLTFTHKQVITWQ
ncbi:sulfurtransferase complex subunit TusB [Colwellia sp. E2M01]|uniref:sulfurtransferase complex subunit TusB n=1 Tax=Colwellia sp. E2M01 TaxID=2841561 RepID=UPI001C09B239|nr:sulfurtransferase complex subunit TusB [Colwellia sp. E2M01]MBU2871465.1 sulfurtransferase complex subunit TusB [Colwellia sp. E2M01]